MQPMLGDGHRESLAWVSRLGEDEAGAMISLAGKMLHEGVTPSTNKAISTAAGKLEMEPEQVSDALHALVHLLTETARLSLGEQDIADSLASLGIGGAGAEALVKGCVEHTDQAKDDISILGGKYPSYKSADWRLECMVGSRTLRGVAEPMYTIQIETEQHGKSQTHTLQAEYSALREACAALKGALQELNSNHYKKVARLTKI